jgi:hypothetical protein
VRRARAPARSGNAADRPVRRSTRRDSNCVANGTWAVMNLAQLSEFAGSRVQLDFVAWSGQNSQSRLLAPSRTTPVTHECITL